MVRWIDGTFIWAPKNLDDRFSVMTVEAFVQAVQSGDFA